MSEPYQLGIHRLSSSLYTQHYQQKAKRIVVRDGCKKRFLRFFKFWSRFTFLTFFFYFPNVLYI